jgi:hypothetical protein
VRRNLLDFSVGYLKEAHLLENLAINDDTDFSVLSTSRITKSRVSKTEKLYTKLKILMSIQC